MDKFIYILLVTLDVVRAEPAIRNPRTRAKPKWTPSRRSWRIPGRGNRATPYWVHKTRAANSRLQVRPCARTHVVFVDEDWEDLCRSASSTTLLVLRHNLPRSIGTHGVGVGLLSL